MTVTTSTNKTQPLGNGVTTSFPYSFRISSASDLVVTSTVIATGVDTPMVLNTDYTVTGAGSYNGGNVVFSVAPADGVRLTIRRVMAVTQGTDLRNQGAYFAETHEDVFDKLTMIDQQQQEVLNRSLTLPPSSSGVSVELPAPEASNILAWNAAANALENIGPVDNAILAAALAESSGAGLIAWTQSGVGAVSRLVRDKLRETVNAADFGAVGDGVANDTVALNKAITYANIAVNGQYKTLVLNPGTYLVTPGGLIDILCNIDGPKAEIKAASNVNAKLITLGHATTGVSGQRITLHGLTGYNFSYGGTAARYGKGIGFNAPAGQFSSQAVVNIFFIQGFIRGVDCDCSAGFHIGTSVFNISTVWYCTYGIYSDSGALQFENMIFDIAYMTFCNFNIYSIASGAAINGQNVYRIKCLELHTIAGTQGFNLVGANNVQNLYIVDSIFYDANTTYIIATDGLAVGNEFRLPDADFAKVSSLGNVLKLDGMGILLGANKTRSIIYGPSPAPTTGTWNIGDQYIVNNPTVGGVASYRNTASGWKADSVSGSGTYTPTATLGTNAAAATPYAASWSRNGDIVTVFGSVDITATAGATATELKLTLPVASSLTASIQLSGVLGGRISNTISSGYINGDAATDKASLQLAPSTTAATNYSYSFSYPVL